MGMYTQSHTKYWNENEGSIDEAIDSLIRRGHNILNVIVTRYSNLTDHIIASRAIILTETKEYADTGPM